MSRTTVHHYTTYKKTAVCHSSVVPNLIRDVTYECSRNGNTKEVNNCPLVVHNFINKDISTEYITYRLQTN